MKRVLINILFFMLYVLIGIFLTDVVEQTNPVVYASSFYILGYFWGLATND